MKCNVCPRNCNVDREKEFGFCKEKIKIRIAKVIENFMWEEPPISRQKGTFAIFFSGCSLKCVFCQNFQISRGGVGKEYDIDQFVNLLKQADKSTAETIDFITPTHFTNQILEAFKIYRPKKPVVWNTSGYEKVETIKKVFDYVDIFLTDFKYYDETISQKFSYAKDYFDVAKKALNEMNKKLQVFENGVLTKGVIIRVLVLPDYSKDAIKILDYIKSNVKEPILSLMSQFTPCGEKKDMRKLKKLEYKVVLNHALKLGLKGYMQEFNSADESYIPSF